MRSRSLHASSTRLPRRRSLIAAGLFVALTAVPAAAQTPAPVDRDAWSNESVKPSAPTPPAAREPNRAPRQPASEPPTRGNEAGDPPPAGCPYRGNKLDLLV